MTSKKDLRTIIRATLNESLIRDLKVSEERVEKLTDLQVEKHLLLEESRKLAIQEKYTEIRKLAKDLTEIEFQMQEAWGFERDLSWHKPWQISGCLCPVVANIERWPADSYLIDGRCPIHGPKKNK